MTFDVAHAIANQPFSGLLNTTDRQHLCDWAQYVADSGQGEALAAMHDNGGALWRAIACSAFVRDTMLAEPEFTGQLLRSHDAVPVLLAPDDESRWGEVLRRYRRCQLLRIAVGDISLGWPLQRVLSALSDTADTCIKIALDVSRQRMLARYGDLRADNGDSVPLLAICMGKLGGNELNFSSDIDLIFAFAHTATSDGRRPLSAAEYCLRQARDVIDLLDKRTQFGRVFRVDTRLRPFGEAGPLAISFDALEDYLAQHGRDWERYAFVKARFVGDDSAAEDIRMFCDSVIRPFVYRRYVDFGVLDALRDMKGMIEIEVVRNDMQQDIKRGPGGIREVEFIAQSWQLIRGGQLAALRTPSLYAALDAIVEHQCMRAETVDGLRSAYAFLRRIENRLQALNDQQTHSLPTEDAARRALAIAAGAANWPALQTSLDTCRETVIAAFEHLLVSSGDAGEQATTVAWLDRPAGSLADAVQALGLAPAEEIADTLRQFWQRLQRTQGDDPGVVRSRTLVNNVMARLTGFDAPLTVLQRVLSVAEAVRRRSAYLSLLNEQPAALDMLMALCASNSFVAQQIAEYPMLIDELLDSQLTSTALSRDDIAAMLTTLPEITDGIDVEEDMRQLVRFARAARFRVAVADLSGTLPVMRVSDRLSDIAELTLARVLRLAWFEMTAKYGKPANSTNQPGLAVIAYGKLGGLELGYGSDLDIIFLHDLPAGETDGERAIDNSVLVTRVARRVVHLLSVQTGHGHLYEVDTRLRPSGRSGLLVSSVAAFARYQREDAWTWEHQALTRTRWITGAPSVGVQFTEVRRRTLCEHVARVTLAKSVSDMRRRMRDALSKSGSEEFDLKQDAGGITDLEFIVQYLVLRDAAKHPDLLKWSDNIRQLDSLADASVLSTQAAQALQEIYQTYRRATHALALEERLHIVADTHFASERAFVHDLWNTLFADLDTA